MYDLLTRLEIGPCSGHRRQRQGRTEIDIAEAYLAVNTAPIGDEIVVEER
jgi:hypothetical protein